MLTQQHTKGASFRHPFFSRIYLVGFMGVGKTTWGKTLAAQLGWEFFDQDKEIEARYAQTVPDLFQSIGEQRFRQYEYATLLRWISAHHRGVLACGGGSPLHFAQLELMLATGLVIWLKMDWEIWLHRAQTLEYRPLLSNLNTLEGQDKLKALFNFRQLYYRKAHIHSNANNGWEQLNFDALVQNMQHISDQMQEEANNATHERAADSDVLQVFTDLKF